MHASDRTGRGSYGGDGEPEDSVPDIAVSISVQSKDDDCKEELWDAQKKMPFGHRNMVGSCSLHLGA